MSADPALLIGGTRPLDGSGETELLALPAHHLTTHGVIVGMTGSGKTGLLMVLIEETLRAGVPTLVLDIKGDLPNLLFTFPAFEPEAFAPWIDTALAARQGRSHYDVAAEAARAHRAALAEWDLCADDAARLRAGVAARVIAPGSSAGEPLDVLSALSQPSSNWTDDPDGARESLTAAISLLLRLLGRDPDPASSRDHVLLAVLAERRLRAGESAGIEQLLEDLESPPVARVGAMELDAFVPPRERRALAAGLNTLLASPSFASWRQGTPLDVGAWLAPVDARTPLVIVSVAHLDDEERALVVGMVLAQVLAWVRAQPGTSALRALVAFDEASGYLPPHPANPPAKRPLVALMKQARAYGVGVLVATQNPMDLDYRALSNAGLWWVGRLQTDADRARVVEGLVGSGRAGEGGDARELAGRIKVLAPRWFVMRDARGYGGPVLATSRATMAWMRGPMTRREIARLRGM